MPTEMVFTLRFSEYLGNPIIYTEKVPNPFSRDILLKSLFSVLTRDVGLNLPLRNQKCPDT